MHDLNRRGSSKVNSYIVAYFTHVSNCVLPIDSG